MPDLFEAEAKATIFLSMRPGQSSRTPSLGGSDNSLMAIDIIVWILERLGFFNIRRQDHNEGRVAKHILMKF